MTHYALSQLKTKLWNVKEKSFENHIVEMFEDLQQVLNDFDNRVANLEVSSATALQAEIDLLRGELGDVRAELATVSNDLSFEAIARTSEIINIHDKLEGCSWCATGKLGATVS